MRTGFILSNEILRNTFHSLHQITVGDGLIMTHNGNMIPVLFCNLEKYLA